MSKVYFKAFTITILGLTSMLACTGTAGDNLNTSDPVPPDNLVKEQSAKPAQELPNMGLPINGRLDHILTLHLNETLDTYPSDPHIAIKYYDFDSQKTTFQIFKQTTDHNLESVFKMDTFIPKRLGLNLEEIVQFPSYRLPGIVLWFGDYEIREEAMIVCYVNGRFQIVFGDGRPNFFDLDNDGITEIFTRQHTRDENGYLREEKGYLVLVWNGSEYVRVTTFEDWEDRFSDEVRQAVKQAKKKQEPKK